MAIPVGVQWTINPFSGPRGPSGMCQRLLDVCIDKVRLPKPEIEPTALREWMRSAPCEPEPLLFYRLPNEEA